MFRSRALIGAGVIALALTAYGGAARGAVPFPAAAPWFNVSRPLDWSDMRGHAVLLDFFTPGCINCIHMVPVEEQLARRFGQRLVIVGVDSPKFSDSGTVPGLMAFITQYRIRHPVLLDAHSRLWDSYQVVAWPTFILFGADGKERARFIGEQTAASLSGPIAIALAHAPAAKSLKPLPMRVVAMGGGALDAPGGLAVAGAVVAVSDTGHNRILLANREGKVTVVIGNGCAGWRDGGYAQAEFARPHGLAFYDGKLYVADTLGQRIRVVNLKTHEVTTLAGSGVRSFISDGEFPAATATLNSPWDVVWAGGKLYVAMAGDHDVWRYAPASRQLGPWAGSGNEGLADGPRASAEFAQTSGLTTHAGTLYTADPESSAIREITLANGEVKTLIGQGLFAFGLRDGAAHQALLQHAEALTWLDGSLYIADTFNNALRRLDLANGEVTTVAKGLAQPQALAVLDANTLLVAEAGGDRVVAVNLPNGKVVPWPLKGLEPPATCSAKP